MTVNEESPETEGAAKLERLRAAIGRGRRSGISDRAADEILAEARAAARSTMDSAREREGGAAPRPGPSVTKG
ncbi:MAG TPA: hypothetical protein PKA13_24250 [Geminicoccaceae bacterium]|nr:hypothetical protein [Geminicoccus sp.]HMU52910.1 hypothetical protein [Geminicoccaceae bacterium]